MPWRVKTGEAVRLLGQPPFVCRHLRMAAGRVAKWGRDSPPEASDQPLASLRLRYVNRP